MPMTFRISLPASPLDRPRSSPCTNCRTTTSDTAILITTHNVARRSSGCFNSTTAARARPVSNRTSARMTPPGPPTEFCTL